MIVCGTMVLLWSVFSRYWWVLVGIKFINVFPLIQMTKLNVNMVTLVRILHTWVCALLFYFIWRMIFIFEYKFLLVEQWYWIDKNPVWKESMHPLKYIKLGENLFQRQSLFCKCTPSWLVILWLPESGYLFGQALCVIIWIVMQQNTLIPNSLNRRINLASIV